MKKTIDENEWAHRQDFLILPGDRIIGVQNPIFYSGIKMSVFSHEVPDPDQNGAFGTFREYKNGRPSIK